MQFRFSVFGPIAFLMIATGAGAVGCSSSTSGAATGATCPTNSTLTYANFGQAFFQTNCSECHAGKENPNLSTLASIQANRTLIDQEAAAGPNATNTAMPQSGSVSDADRTKLGEWLACGAPQ